MVQPAKGVGERAPKTVSPEGGAKAPAAPTPETQPKTGVSVAAADSFSSPFAKALDRLRGSTIGFIADAIAAELSSSGIGGRPVEGWLKRSDRLAGIVKRAIEPGSGVSSPEFHKTLEALTDSRFTSGNSVRLLADGPSAWETRKAMIQGAQHNIKLMTWAFKNDETGNETAQLLIDKARLGVSVEVMVDYDFAQKEGYKEPVELLEQAAARGLPIKVLRWENPKRWGEGQHQKYLVVDHGAKAIAGGRNPCDVYYERGPKASWRDAEVEVSGPAAVELNRAFIRTWNDRLADPYKLPKGSFAPLKAPPLAPTAGGSAKTALVEHVPGGVESNITVATLAAIRASKKSFSMANAYLISIPAIRAELKAAAKRGVDVRVMTNSASTLDEAGLTIPILETVLELKAAGVKVYLQKPFQSNRVGSNTLHAKFWVADDSLHSMQSHNEHPRSEYYELEIALLTSDVRAAEDLKAYFEQLTAPSNADEIKEASQVVIPSDWMSKVRAWMMKNPFHRQS